MADEFVPRDPIDAFNEMWVATQAKRAAQDKAEFASSVLAAMTRKLADYDRLRGELDALRAAKPGPFLTPLREESRTNRHDATVVRIGQGITLTICARAYGNTKTVLSMPQGRSVTFDYDGHSPIRESALADVNAILARYGYVLEQWP